MEINSTNSTDESAFPLYLSITYDWYTINQLSLIAISMVFNIFVLGYHWFNPAHPKYYLSKTKTLSIITHLVSGTIETTCAIVSFFVYDPIPWCYAMAGAVCAGHVPASLYQTPNVFGLKSIMVPAYLFVIFLHLTGGILIFLYPGNPKYIIGTILIQSIYVYCRVFYFVLAKFNIFTANRYTVSILVSGLILLPAATQSYLSNIVLLFWILVINMLVYAYVYCVGEQYFLQNYWHVENHRETFGKHAEFTQKMAVQANIHSADDLKSSGILANILEAHENTTLPEQARKVWNQIDANGDGKITKEEFAVHLSKFGMEADQIQKEMKLLDTLFGNLNHMDYHIFYRWFCGGRIASKQFAQALPVPKDEKDQARLIFDNLDIDSSGYLEIWELETLLLNWGVSPSDAKIFLKSFDDGDNRVSFDEFYRNMKRIWKYAIEIMVMDGRLYFPTDSSSAFCCCPVKDDKEYTLLE
jgi:Ca2+-binding EF-hand superfamily protein